MKNTEKTIQPQDVMFAEVGPDDDDGIIPGNIMFAEVGPDDDDGLYPAG